MDSGPCETLAVVMGEVSPFTLLAPLVADVPRPSDPNLRIHSRVTLLYSSPTSNLLARVLFWDTYLASPDIGTRTKFLHG
jgi:hypothetical protein